MKRIINSYIIRTIVMSTVFVILFIIGLQIFILFTHQISDFSSTNYSISTIIFHILLQIPYQIYKLFPIIILLGCLIGLSILAQNNELIIMQVSGISIFNIMLIIFKISLLISFIVTVIGETIIPKLTYITNNEQINISHLTNYKKINIGFWIKNNENYIYISKIQSYGYLKNIYQFHFNSLYKIDTIYKIDIAKYINNIWYAFNIEKIIISNNKIYKEKIYKMIWNIFINPYIFNIFNKNPNEMTLYELRKFLKISNKNNNINYRLSYLQRIIQPFTIMIMMVISIPFIFGQLRSTTIISKFLYSIIIGISFYLVNRLFTQITQILKWSPIFSIIMPKVLFLLVGIYYIYRHDINIILFHVLKVLKLYIKKYFNN